MFFGAFPRRLDGLLPSSPSNGPQNYSFILTFQNFVLVNRLSDLALKPKNCDIYLMFIWDIMGYVMTRSCFEYKHILQI